MARDVYLIADIFRTTEDVTTVELRAVLNRYEAVRYDAHLSISLS